MLTYSIVKIACMCLIVLVYVVVSCGVGVNVMYVCAYQFKGGWENDDEKGGPIFLRGPIFFRYRNTAERVSFQTESEN